MIRHHLVTALLLVNALLYAWVAVLFLFDAPGWFSRLGVEQASPAGYTELRTVYLGLMAAMAVFFGLSAWQPSLRQAGVLFLVISYAGLVLGRSWGILIESAYNSFVLQLYAAEWVALVLAVLAWRYQRRT